MEITNKRELAEAYRSGPYTWWGGYPTFLVLSDNETLCWKCFRKEYKNIWIETEYPEYDTGWRAVGAEINWEDKNLYCVECQEKLESAY